MMLAPEIDDYWKYGGEGFSEDYGGLCPRVYGDSMIVCFGIL
jgi:hypothetical protein